MTKLAPEWVRTSNPVIRSPARYRWTTAPAFGDVKTQLIDFANFLELEFDSRSKKVLINELVAAELVSRDKLPTSVMEDMHFVWFSM